MPMGEAEARAQGRQEAAPAALVALLVFVVLAGVSRAQEWKLLGLPWWIWLLVAAPVLVLAIDLSLTYRGSGLVRSRRARCCSSAFSYSGTSPRWRFSSQAW